MAKFPFSWYISQYLITVFVQLEFWSRFVNKNIQKYAHNLLESCRASSIVKSVDDSHSDVTPLFFLNKNLFECPVNNALIINAIGLCLCVSALRRR